MAQHDYNIANQTASNFRSDLNNSLSAIVSQNAGISAPSTTFANMLWYDTSNNILKMRNEADSAWINLLTLNQSGNLAKISNSTGVDSKNVSGTAGSNTTFGTWNSDGDLVGTSIASQAEAEAGTNNTKPMTPLRVAQAVGGLRSTQVFTTSGTWNRPTGIKAVLIIATGGGSNGTTSGGGSAGGTAIKVLDVTAISSATITVGAVGGLSRWSGGVTVEAEGGGSAGSSTGGDINIQRTLADENSKTGVASWWGGQGTVGGSSTSATGTAAQGYGSGGGGGGSYGSGGAGAQGIVWVLEF